MGGRGAALFCSGGFMSDVDVKSLLLQVDASVELLRKNLASGEGVMDRFERRGERMAQVVDDAIGKMGQRFGPFAQLAESAAQKAQKSFESSFTQIQQLAAKAEIGRASCRERECQYV